MSKNSFVDTAAVPGSPNWDKLISRRTPLYERPVDVPSQEIIQEYCIRWPTAGLSIKLRYFLILTTTTYAQEWSMLPT